MANTSHLKSMLAISSVAVFGLPSFVAAAQVVRIGGSSTVYPVTKAVAEEFQKASAGSKVTVGVSGTGGGFRQFGRGEIDIVNASRPIARSEMQECRKAGVEYCELPVAFDALTVAVNPRNTWLNQATVADLKKLWEPAAHGRITRWNQLRPAWPDQPIKLFGTGADSGTFDYFTEAIVGRSKSSRGDCTTSKDDHAVVRGVAGDLDAIGCLGHGSYAANQNRLKALAIVPADGKPAVGPSELSVLDGTYQPLSRPLFIYVRAEALARPEVRKFVEFYLAQAARMARRAKYAPLPAEAYSTGLDLVSSRRKGTVFGGRNGIGVTITDVMKREVVF